MNFSNEQLNVMKTKLNTINLVEGYSRVGKTTVLLHKFFDLLANKNNQHHNAYFVVKDDIKKEMIIRFSKDLNDHNIDSYILTFDELIHAYIHKLNMPLFKNRISHLEQIKLIHDIAYKDLGLKQSLDIDLLMKEISFIQSNICLDEKANLEKILEKELQSYLLLARKNNMLGLLTFEEKKYVWRIYVKYLYKALQSDIFDNYTLYQSVLRMIYHDQDPVLPLNYLFIDDAHQFSKIQLDILYHLLNKQMTHYVLMTIDPLKSYDRHHHYRNSRLFEYVDGVFQFTLNFYNSHNVFEILTSHINNNELFLKQFDYETKEVPKLKSTMTYFYNKLTNEKMDVFFDRLDLLTNTMHYNFNDILVIFFDNESYKAMYEECMDADLPIISIREKLIEKKSGLVFMRKEEIIPTEFKVVLFYNADNKKIGNGPINRVMNVNTNYRDSILFYTAIGIASDFVMINTSISEPSTFLLPSNLDDRLFVFEIGTQFTIKANLNLYRISDFIQWIQEQLIQFYHYKSNDFSSHPIFDLLVEHESHQIAIKILDRNADDSDISSIIKKGLKYPYIVIFDSHHFLVFRNNFNSFTRLIDIPKKGIQ